MGTGTAASPAAARMRKEWHRRQAALPMVGKVRILLQLQRDDLPLIRRHRLLKPWERPREIEPWRLEGHTAAKLVPVAWAATKPQTHGVPG